MEKFLKIFLVALTLLTFHFTCGSADAGNLSYATDAGCNELNAPFEKTRNSSRYQEIISLENPQMAPVEVAQYRFDGIDHYKKINGAWTKLYREVIGTKQDGEPVFTGCLRLPEERVGDVEVLVIQGSWHRGRNRAICKAWISRETGKLVKLERTFTVAAPSSGFKSGDTAVENFTYDRNLEQPELGVPARDSRCDYVNGAYENTANTGRYTVTVYQFEADGTRTPWLEERYSGRTVVDELKSAPWTKSTIARKLRGPFENGEPLFRQCQLIRSETIFGANTAYYIAEWRKGKFQATMEIWISVDSQKFVVARQRFRAGRSAFPFNDAIIEFSYDQSH